MRWHGKREGRLAPWALATLALSVVACGKDAVVGGGCRTGLTECSLQCTDLMQDPANCGACGHACASGQSCSVGSCSQSDASIDVAVDGEGADANIDAGVPDMARDLGVSDTSVTDVPRESSVLDGQADMSTTDGTPDTGAADGARDVSVADGRPDQTSSDSSLGDAVSPDAPTCMPPFDTPDRCGDCFTKCAAPTPLCGLQQGMYKCVAKCDPPLIDCGVCINPASDETNCGNCGVTCPSGICQAGGCVGKGYGHEIVVGADYSDTTLLETSAPVTMLGNAIFQSVASTVHVLAYTEFADASVVTRVEGWLSSMSASRGKTITMTKAADWMAIPSQLTVTQYQVFLVYDQALAPAGQMATTGTLWNDAISAFAKGGGIIVALDGGSAGQMKDMLTNGGLLEVTGETDVTGTQLNVDAPTDVVGQNLPNVFAAKKSTVAFTTTQMRDNYHVFVVTDATGMLPVVVHSVPKP